MCEIDWQDQVLEGVQPSQCGQCGTDSQVQLAVVLVCDYCGCVMRKVTIPSVHTCLPEEFEAKREEAQRLVAWTATIGF